MKLGGTLTRALLLVCLLVVTAVVVGFALFSPRAAESASPDVKANAEAFSKKIRDEKAAAERVVLERDTVPVIAAGRPVEALVLGDSLARGSAASAPEFSYTALTDAALDKAAPANVTTIASGSSGGGIRVADITPQIPSKAFDLVVFELGTNDVITPNLAAFKAEYAELLAAVRAASPGASIVCLGPWGSPKDTEAFNAEVTAQCSADAKARYRDLSALYASEKNRWVTGKMPDGTPVDNFHPNDAGHAAVAKQIASAIRFS